MELQQKSALKLVDVWLGLLLGDTSYLLCRQLSYEVELSVDLCDREARHQGGRAGIWSLEDRANV
jgi:hypothetical protein